MTESKKKILVLCEQYLPAFKAGGVIQAIRGIFGALGDRFEFYLITGDRDLGDDVPFPDVVLNSWTNLDGINIIYIPLGEMRVSTIAKAISDFEIDLIYLPSFFSIFPRTVYRGIISGTIVVPVVLAPHGQLATNAFALKFLKKMLFLSLFRLFFGADRFIWHATSEDEVQSIRRLFPSCQIFLAHNISSQLPQKREDIPQMRPLKVIYFGRLSEKKNLHFGLQVLAGVKSSVIFDIYGPLEDVSYVEKCKNIAKNLPSHIRVNFFGPRPFDDLAKIFSDYHVFLFPSLNENFGYAVLEAVLAGIVPVLSDETFWTFLAEKKAGFAIPLKNPELFTQAIEYFANLPSEDFMAYRSRALEEGRKYISQSPGVREHEQMFVQSALKRK